MKRLSATMALILMLAQAPVLADTVFGTRPNLPGVVRISEMLDHPDKYVGKVIKVEGIATDVCPKRGCWMTIQSDRKQQSLFVKVQDGEMVFPMSARGKHIVLQGKLFKINMSLEETRAFEKERALETGRSFDPNSVKKASVKFVFKPSGVIVLDK